MCQASEHEFAHRSALLFPQMLQLGHSNTAPGSKQRCQRTPSIAGSPPPLILLLSLPEIGKYHWLGNIPKSLTCIICCPSSAALGRQACSMVKPYTFHPTQRYGLLCMHEVFAVEHVCMLMQQCCQGTDSCNRHMLIELQHAAVTLA